MNMKSLLAAAVAALTTLSAQAALVEGQDYTVLAKPLTQQQADKIEVTEFFSYTCSHCFHLNPILLERSKTWNDAYIHPIQVIWDPSWLGFARIAAAVNSSGLKYEADPAIFAAVQTERKNLSDSDTFKKWAAAQTAFDGKKLLAAYESFSNQAQAAQMGELAAQYNIEQTPTIIVGGKYQMILNGGDWSQRMDKVEEMLAKVRAERGMKAVPAAAKTTTAPAAAVRSRAAAIAKSANR